MNRSIFKYLLRLLSVQEIMMPKGAEVLSVGVQRGAIQVWAMVDTEQKVSERRTFHLIGTGNRFPEQEPYSVTKLELVGRVALHDDALIFHVFEERLDEEAL